jgi:hypothetical protein
MMYLMNDKPTNECDKGENSTEIGWLGYLAHHI